MAVVNPGDPISALRSALDAYTTVQQTMIDEAEKLRESAPTAPVSPEPAREEK